MPTDRELLREARKLLVSADSTLSYLGHRAGRTLSSLFGDDFVEDALQTSSQCRSAVASIDAALAAPDPRDKVLDAVKTVFGPDGCACIKDLPGDNYTCVAHQRLWRFARGESA